MLLSQLPIHTPTTCLRTQLGTSPKGQFFRYPRRWMRPYHNSGTARRCSVGMAGGREPPVEIVGGADQRQMREGLRKAAEVLRCVKVADYAVVFYRRVAVDHHMKRAMPPPINNTKLEIAGRTISLRDF